MSSKLNLANKFFYIVIGLISIAAIYYRFGELDKFSLWRDELSIYFHTTEPLSFIFNYSKDSSYHPPLLYIFLKWFYMISGFGEVNLRLIHVLIGLISSFIPALLAFKNKIKLEENLILSFLLLTNVSLISWSKEALAYSSAIAIIIVFIYSVKNFYETNVSNKSLFSIILLTIVSGYLNYISFIVIVFCFLSLIIVNIEKRLVVKKLIIAKGIVLLFYLPWIFSNHLFIKALSKTDKINFWNKPLKVLPINNDQKMNSVYDIFISLFSYSHIVLMLTIGVIIYSLFKNKKDRGLLSFSLAALFFILWAFTFSYFKYSILINKYFVVVVPFILVAFSKSLMKFKGQYRYIALIIISLLNLSAYSRYENSKWKEEVRESISFMQKGTKGSKIFMNIYNVKWYLPYLKRNDLISQRVIIYDMSWCTDNRLKSKKIAKLSKGDFIFSIPGVCNHNELLLSLDNMQKQSEITEFKNVVIVQIKD